MGGRSKGEEGKRSWWEAQGEDGRGVGGRGMGRGSEESVSVCLWSYFRCLGFVDNFLCVGETVSREKKSEQGEGERRGGRKPFWEMDEMPPYLLTRGIFIR